MRQVNKTVARQQALATIFKRFVIGGKELSDCFADQVIIRPIQARIEDVAVGRRTARQLRTVARPNRFEMLNDGVAEDYSMPSQLTSLRFSEVWGG